WLPLRDAQSWPATARPNQPWLALAGRLPASSTLKGARAELELAARLCRNERERSVLLAKAAALA
ncbi:MAG TPA: hypothetical protein VMU51_02225, partial [Mycobacteriales bacterium]|nr:hypothetical protein [Mycobacteriales bacterium]